METARPLFINTGYGQLRTKERDMKNDDSDMKWEILSSEYLSKRPWMTVRKDCVRLPSGVVNPEYYVLEYPDWCNVIAIDKDGNFLIERQYRHAQRQVGYEMPAGCVEEGETPLEAAQRELYEETGYGKGEWSLFMKTSPNPSTNTNHCYTFLAVGVERISTQHLEKTEDIKVLHMSRDDVFALLAKDGFYQALMAAPLWKYFWNEKNR